jgi:hypothetical protein
MKQTIMMRVMHRHDLVPMAMGMPCNPIGEDNRVEQHGARVMTGASPRPSPTVIMEVAPMTKMVILVENPAELGIDAGDQ